MKTINLNYFWEFETSSKLYRIFIVAVLPPEVCEKDFDCLIVSIFFK